MWRCLLYDPNGSTDVALQLVLHVAAFDYPKGFASDKIELMLRKARVVKWNVETIGFSANGFSAYFLFKVLMVIMVAFIFLQAVSFFCRSLAEYREGEKSEGKYLDLDGKDTAPTADAEPQQTK